MKKSAVTLGSALALTAATFAMLQAQDAPMALPGQPDAGRVTAGTYSVDPAHTLVQFRVDHFGFNDYFGIFGDTTGTLQLDPANLSAATLDVSVPVASVTVASEGLRDHLLRPGKDGGSPDFFGAAPAPARFVSTAVYPLGPTEAAVAGNLTLNGVTKPVTILAEFTGAGASPMGGAETVGFHGRTTIMRSEFGVDYGVPMVSDEVELIITAAFEKK